MCLVTEQPDVNNLNLNRLMELVSVILDNAGLVFGRSCHYRDNTLLFLSLLSRPSPHKGGDANRVWGIQVGKVTYLGVAPSS